MKLFLKSIFVFNLLITSSLGSAQIPDTRHSQGIPYITGGFGKDEVATILAESKKRSLLIELSQIENGRGVWIFGAKVKIINSNKQVIFDAQADGPYLLLNLDPGDYSIEASYQGIEQKRFISIKAATPQKIAILWK